MPQTAGILNINTLYKLVCCLCKISDNFRLEFKSIFTTEKKDKIN